MTAAAAAVISKTLSSSGDGLRLLLPLSVRRKTAPCLGRRKTTTTATHGGGGAAAAADSWSAITVVEFEQERGGVGFDVFVFCGYEC